MNHFLVCVVYSIKTMKPYLFNLINAIILISMGSWAYFTSETPSVTALIPVFAGIVLLALTPGFKKGNSVIAHIAVTLTLIVFAGLFKPLSGTIGRADHLGTARVILMMLSSLAALAAFVLSFINARRNPESKMKK
jgi:hypothetical protein